MIKKICYNFIKRISRGDHIMDNYEVAINGTKLAAQILGIETPDVQFFL
jgi:hypothetical protein